MKRLSLKRVIMTVLSAAVVFSAIPSVFADETAEADYEVIYSAQYTGVKSDNYTVSPYYACTNDYLATDSGSKLVAIKPKKNGADIAFDSSKTYILSLKMKKDSAVPLNFCFFGFCKGNYKDEPEYDGYDRAIRLNEEWQTYSWKFSGGEYPTAPWIRFQGGAGEDKFYLKDIKITELKTNIPELTAAPATVNTSNEIKIRYSYDMSGDAADKANYTIDGGMPESVTYDSATKTATLVPAEGIVGTSAEVTMNVSDVTGRTLNTAEVSLDNPNRKIIKYKTVTANILENAETEDYKVIYSAQYEGKTSTNYALTQYGNCGEDYLAIGGPTYVAIKPQENGADIAFDNGKNYVISLKMKKDSAADINTRFYTMCTPEILNENWEINPSTNIRLSDNWQTYSWTVSGKVFGIAPWLRFNGKSGDKFYLKDIKITELKKEISPLTATAEPLNTSNTIKIKYSYDMSAEAADEANYTIGDEMPQSVTYDSATKTATLVPAKGIVGTSTDVTMNVSDVTGRTLNTVEVSSDNAGRKIIKFKTVTAAYPENTLGAPVPNVTDGTATIGGLYNTTASEQKAILIVAAFDSEGCLAKAAVNNITIQSGVVLPAQSVSLETVPDGCSIRAFIWDSSTLKAIETEE